MLMSFATDLHAFHLKYGFHDHQLTASNLSFRIDLLEEELYELKDAVSTRNCEEIVDALIDLIYIAVGTLDLAQVDIPKAWSAVHDANMTKVRGIKPGREQSDGFDVVKPNGWTPPSHEGNHGCLPTILA
jgi:predicted HAD superfamily Cof-like phosphohydrolase